jgi:hypothetical protein
MLMSFEKTQTTESAKLTEQFVAFIDLLGFREEMARQGRGGRL